MSGRIEFRYIIEMSDWFYGTEVFMKPVTMEVGSSMLWALKKFSGKRIKVVSMSPPIVAPTLCIRGRAKAHYKLLRHHYKKSKKQERVDK